MRARAALTVLIGVFMMWIIGEAKALPFMIPAAAENGTPKITKAVRIQDNTGKMNLADMLTALSLYSSNIWKADKKATIFGVIGEIFNFSRCKFQSSKIVMPEGTKVSYWPTGNKRFIRDPAFRHCAFRIPYVREYVKNITIHEIDFPQNNLWPVRRNEFSTGEIYLILSSIYGIPRNAQLGSRIFGLLLSYPSGLSDLVKYQTNEYEVCDSEGYREVCHNNVSPLGRAFLIMVLGMLTGQVIRATGVWVFMKGKRKFGLSAAVIGAFVIAYTGVGPMLGWWPNIYGCGWPF